MTIKKVFGIMINFWGFLKPVPLKTVPPNWNILWLYNTIISCTFFVSLIEMKNPSLFHSPTPKKTLPWKTYQTRFSWGFIQKRSATVSFPSMAAFRHFEHTSLFEGQRTPNPLSWLIFTPRILITRKETDPSWLIHQIQTPQQLLSQSFVSISDLNKS